MTHTQKQTFKEYEVLTPYEFTINMHDDYQYPFHELRIMKSMKILRDVLEHNTFLYHFKTELSEPHFGDRKTITRIHFHGVILFRDKSELHLFLLLTMNQLMKIGRICINSFRKDIWLPYIDKQQWIHKRKDRDLYNIKLSQMLDYVKPETSQNQTDEDD